MILKGKDRRMILQSKRVWILNDWQEAQIEISEKMGKIEGIYPYGTRKAAMDFDSLRMVPGFIDVHAHGGYGFDTNDAEEEGLKNWMARVVSEGVTGILPTTITQSEEVLTKALKNVAKVARQQRKAPESVPGAQILGIHLEGPYLDKTFNGAHPEPFCIKPDVGQFERYLAASDGLIRIVTLACEHDTGYRLTRFLSEHGIVPSLGHSSATYAQAAFAFANGVRSVTHVYNGMAPYHHRENGLTGAALSFRNVFGEIICDGLHSTWGALRTFFTNKGPDYGVMITDSLRVKGLPAGTPALFGGDPIELSKDGSARLVESGKLAGSTLKMNEGLLNLVEKACVSWQHAINSCTLNPARLIGLEASKGSLQTGKDADIVVLRDDYSIETVFVGGRQRA